LEAIVNLLRKSWPDVLVVVGVIWLSWSCSAYSGYGSVDGHVDDGNGEVSGDFSISYSDEERLQIVLGAASIAVGALAKFNRRNLA
jgi:hypothetical protein